jgi:hypothetical protein
LCSYIVIDADGIARSLGIVLTEATRAVVRGQTNGGAR